MLLTCTHNSPVGGGAMISSTTTTTTTFDNSKTMSANAVSFAIKSDKTLSGVVKGIQNYHSDRGYDHSIFMDQLGKILSFGRLIRKVETGSKFHLTN